MSVYVCELKIKNASAVTKLSQIVRYIYWYAITFIEIILYVCMYVCMSTTLLTNVKKCVLYRLRLLYKAICFIAYNLLVIVSYTTKNHLYTKLLTHIHFIIIVCIL